MISSIVIRQATLGAACLDIAISAADGSRRSRRRLDQADRGRFGGCHGGEASSLVNVPFGPVVGCSPELKYSPTLRAPYRTLREIRSKTALPVTQTSGLRPQKPDTSATVSRAAPIAWNALTAGVVLAAGGSAGNSRTT